MASAHVVVDGSNLATEGRTLPSLTQLEEAVAAYEDEHPGAELIVVVDATFEHRIDEKDRPRFKEAELRGEYVAPPAGAIGRGDAFILKIAKQTDALVLSNDSFQEFHGEHPWLFEEGRLVGGKPVPVVGWIFTPRNPVRGVKSRAATREAAKKAGPVKKLAVRRPDGSTPKVGDTLTPAPVEPAPRKNVRVYELAKELGLENRELLALAAKAKVAVKSHSSSLAPDEADSIRAAAAARKIKASELATELGIEIKALKELAASAKVKVASASTPLTQDDVALLRRVAERSVRRASAAAAAVEAAAAPAATTELQDGGRRRRRGRRRGGSDREQAPAAEAPSSPSSERSGRSESSPDAPGNEPLTFVHFIATHEVGSSLEGTVTAFTSHGAMVDVALGGGEAFHCYVRTVNLGDPAPTRARDAVAKGTVYTFTLLTLDPVRRVAELALAPTSAAVEAEAPTPSPTAARAPSRRAAKKPAAAAPAAPAAASAAPRKAASSRSAKKPAAEATKKAAKQAPKKTPAPSSKKAAPSPKTAAAVPSATAATAATTKRGARRGGSR